MTISKFEGENNWKLTDLGKITPFGSPMRGTLRTGAPPESVSECTALSTEEKGLKKIVSFDDSFNNSETKGDIENRKLEKTSLAFTPHKCSASISWDIWSLGL